MTGSGQGHKRALLPFPMSSCGSRFSWGKTHLIYYDKYKNPTRTPYVCTYVRIYLFVCLFEELDSAGKLGCRQEEHIFGTGNYATSGLTVGRSFEFRSPVGSGMLVINTIWATTVTLREASLLDGRQATWCVRACKRAPGPELPLRPPGVPSPGHTRHS